MAKTTITQVTDDLDGSKDATEIHFAFNGVEYTIDLSKKNAAAMEKALKPYLEVATKKTSKTSTSRRARVKNSAPRTDYAAIRDWARAQGLTVSERGRVPAAIVEQYEAANTQ